MAERRTYTLPDGTEVTIRPISALALQLISTTSANMPKKPQVPRIEVGTRSNGKPRMESNPDDPDYKEAVTQWKKAVKDWEADRNFKTIRYIIDRGVEDDPPLEWIENNIDLIQGMSDAEVKYFWIADILEGEDDLQMFTEAIMGQTMPTQEGVTEAMESFHADGQRDSSSNELSVPEQE